MHPKWQDLLERMQATGQFSSKLLTHRVLCNQFFAGRTVLRPPAVNGRFGPGPIRAHGALRKTKSASWMEIAQLYVDPELSGNGVMREIIGELMEKRRPGVRFFGITKVSSVMRAFVESGLKPTTKYDVPDIESWAAEIGLDRLPESAKLRELSDMRRAGRWLFMER